MKNPFLIGLTAALITAGAIKAAPALAETPAAPDSNVSIVRTADLDLGTERGQQQLRQRVVRAANEVCGTASDADLVGQNAVRKCRQDVIAGATEQTEALYAAAKRGAVIAVTAAR